ncbi:MAG: type II toxin-antitoxin system VapC family toxin [Chloroflexi bacterium]|nr:MAG: type II toxin-antitoxin system VapC family toxin [Chloroflexota bacterium]
MLAESATGVAAATTIATERIVVPAHFDIEVYGSFRRLFRQGTVTRGRFDAIAVRLARLAAERVGLSGLMLDAHVIADRISAADAFYVALARLRRIELWTADAGLERAAAGLAKVRLIA